MGWIWLVLAIMLEVGGTTCLKLSDGFSRLGPSLGVLAFYVLSFGTLGIALKQLEIGIAYAVWSGLGTLAIALIGIVAFAESTSLVKFAAIALIIAGVALLRLAES
ncbi:MAG TPA: multidrug efflux SMR transporter [Nevskiales bacterium]|nr:multidrug efflux SMR transporter [Nevskiales bacterium]